MAQKDVDTTFNELAGLTVPVLLKRRAEQFGSKLALSAPAYKGYQERLTYWQLVENMESVAQGFHIKGLRSGDRIALFLSNNAMREAIFSALGAYRLGAIAAPLNVRSTDNELIYVLNLIKPRYIVTTPEHADRLRRFSHEMRLLVVGMEHDGEDTWPDPEIGLYDTEIPAVHVDAEQPSILLLTSGTTAWSKAVLHCHRSQLYAGLSVGSAIGLTSADIYQGAWPIYTSSVLNMACMSAWVHGSSLVLEPDGLNNANRLRMIRREGTSVYHGVTAILNFMMEEYEKGHYDLTFLRRLVYGGSAMPAEIIHKFARQLPWVDQVHIWGMTETGPAGTVLPSWYLPRKAGSIGGPMPTCSIRIVSEQGQVAAANEIGEIFFSGPSMALGYWQDEEETSRAFINGWVRSGDLGYRDDEGHFHFVDRSKDTINRGGMIISSAAVE